MITPKHPKNRSVQRRKRLKSKLPQRDTSTKKARPTRKEKSTPTVVFSVKIRSSFFPLSVGYFSEYVSSFITWNPFQIGSFLLYTLALTFSVVSLRPRKQYRPSPKAVLKLTS